MGVCFCLMQTDISLLKIIHKFNEYSVYLELEPIDKPQKYQLKTIKMKTLLLFSIILLYSSLFAQDKKEITVKTEVGEATVFINGAQVVRKKTIDLPSGISLVRFTELSPYLDVKSLQLKTGENAVVLSVNHQFNYSDSAGRSKEIEGLVNRYAAIEDKIKQENISLSIIAEELAFLKDNRIIGGKNQEVSFNNLKETANFYRDRITALKMKESENTKNISKLNNEKSLIDKQIRQISSIKASPQSEVWAKIETKSPLKCELELSYFVSNVGWFPSYDVRAKSIADPIELIYKANIHQSTKEDWKNIKLKLSSGNPSQGGVAPQLQTYSLNYGSVPPRYRNIENQVNGKVIDAKERKGLPGVSVSIKGSTIGTITDLDGNYSISIPNNNSQLEYNMVGFEKQTLSVYGTIMNVELQEIEKNLDEVVVVGYGTMRKDDMDMDLKSSSPSMESPKKERKKLKTAPQRYIQSQMVENETNFEFDVKNLYTINSDNKNITVDINSYSLEAKYEYYCAPKADKDAFLMANILDWEKYNIMEGEANIFFENTFVGKTILDVRNITDTLSLSLGRDKSVSVKREKVKDFTKKQFLSSKKEDTRDWMISIKNNKKQAINMVLYDQVPVSNNEEIEVTVENISGANLNKESGELKWKLNLEPNGKKDYEVKYKVKYPKEKSLIVE